MAQEVQTTLDYRVELNEIQWIWYQQRKIRDKTQIRDKTTNGTVWLGWQTIIKSSAWEVTVPSWTLTSSWWVEYESSWSWIIIPEGWPYLFQYIPQTNYTQDSYYFTIRVYVEWKEVYSERTVLGDHRTKEVALNLGKRNRLEVTFDAEFSAQAAMHPTIKLTKL